MPVSQVVILVVEDEALIRMDAADQLATVGFSVIEASTGQEARQVLETGDRVDLVFTDVDMPGEPDGLLLAREIRSRWPAIPVILTSGKHSIQNECLPDRCSFFPKPYDHGQVHARMRELIGALPN
jgi:CheY-like chemotaxis protein